MRVTIVPSLALMLLAQAAVAPGAEAPPPADAAALQELRTSLVEPFLSRWKGKLASASGLKSIQPRLKSLLAEVERWASSRKKDPAGRRALALAVEDLLSSGLAPELGSLGGDAASTARSLVREAAADHRTDRIESLYRSILCWCPNEGWTRTLSGCTESCADEQKGMVRRGVDEGLSDEEIIQQMVDHPKGGPRVRAAAETTGTNLLGFILPLVFVVAAVLAVPAVLLFSSGRRRAPPHALRGGAPAGADDDGVWGDRIEEELKEMEN